MNIICLKAVLNLTDNDPGSNQQLNFTSEFLKVVNGVKTFINLYYVV